MSELARVRTHREGSTQIVRITGEVDLSNARDVIDAVGHAVPEDVTRIVLDLTDTTYVDSAAIATLFRLSERLRDRRQDLRLVVPRTSPIRAVVELTRLSQVIPVDEVAPTGPPVSVVPPLPYAAVPEAAPSAGSGPDELDGSDGSLDAPDPGPDGPDDSRQRKA
ncbi:STAS domain-containing protein [Terrabacter sp. 2RAF25]|uniref:STAS domain-containing protein n=1 Tax=Terrabacter sp. 2RAF25 TaxID=3232998 RepID=UPI003F997D41